MGRSIDLIGLVCYRTYQAATSQTLALRAHLERLLRRACAAAWPSLMGLTGQRCVRGDGRDLLALGGASFGGRHGGAGWRMGSADVTERSPGVPEAPARAPSSPNSRLGGSTLEPGASVSQMGPTRGSMVRAVVLGCYTTYQAATKGRAIDLVGLVYYRTYQAVTSQTLALRAHLERLLSRACETTWPARMGLTGRWCIRSNGRDLLVLGGASFGGRGTKEEKGG